MQGILLERTGLCERLSWAGNKGGLGTLAHRWGMCLLESGAAADLGFACKELEGRSGLHGNTEGE